MAIGRNKRPIMSSSGFSIAYSDDISDPVQELNSKSLMGECTVKIAGEKVYCVMVASPSQSGDILALRLMASLEPADKQILRLSLIYIIVGLAVLLLVLVVNPLFLHTILKPVSEVQTTARKIAEGDFDVQIENKYNDEMGDLCDILNYMADELSQSENIKTSLYRRFRMS